MIVLPSASASFVVSDDYLCYFRSCLKVYCPDLIGDILGKQMSDLYNLLWGQFDNNSIYREVEYDGPNVIEHEGDTEAIELQMFQVIDVGPDAVLPTNFRLLLVRPEYKQMMSAMAATPNSFAILGGPGIGEFTDKSTVPRD
jgi:hypothetical protein